MDSGLPRPEPRRSDPAPPTGARPTSGSGMNRTTSSTGSAQVSDREPIFDVPRRDSYVASSSTANYAAEDSAFSVAAVDTPYHTSDSIFGSNVRQPPAWVTRSAGDAAIAEGAAERTGGGGDDANRVTVRDEASPTQGASDASAANPAVTMVPQPSVDELIERCVVHLNEPIENLPPIMQQELRLIGRRIVLCCTTSANGQQKSFYYHGILSYIARDSVVMLHVDRYTPQQFESRRGIIKDAVAKRRDLRYKYRNRLKKENQGPSEEIEGKEADRKFKPKRRHEADGNSDDGANSEDDLNDFFVYNIPQWEEAHQAAPRFEEVLEREGSAMEGAANTDAMVANYAAIMGQIQIDSRTGAGGQSALELPPKRLSARPLELADAQAISSQTAASNVEENGSPTSRRSCIPDTGEFGPVPSITFNRRHISDIVMGIDPPHSFFSLFEDPVKHFFDMECLRVLVRRYLVHTCQANNDLDIPLRSYVAYRGNCGTRLDDQTLTTVAKEEVEKMARISLDLSQHFPTSAAYGSLQQIQTGLNGLSLRRALAPTTLLYRTGLPTRMFIVSVLHLVIAVVLSMYYIVIFSVADGQFLYRYLSHSLVYFVVTVVLIGIEGALTCYQAIRITVPVNRIVCILRHMFSLGGFAFIIYSIVRMITTEMTYDRVKLFYDDMQMNRQTDLCTYFTLQKCSCFFTPSQCSPVYMCGSAVQSVSCGSIMMSDVQTRFYPPLVLSFVAVLFLLYDLILQISLIRLNGKIMMYIRALGYA